MNTPKMPPPNMADLDDVICQCGSTIFSTGLRLKTISAIQSRSKRGSVWIQYVAYCTKCKTPEFTVPMPETKPDTLPYVTPEDLEQIVCVGNGCESTLFRTAKLAKRLSAIQSQTGQESVATQGVAICVYCYEPILNLVK